MGNSLGSSSCFLLSPLSLLLLLLLRASFFSFCCSAPLCSHLFIRALIAMFIASYSLWQWSNVRSLLQTRARVCVCVCVSDTFDNPINIYEALYWNNTELLYGRRMYACPSIRYTHVSTAAICSRSWSKIGRSRTKKLTTKQQLHANHAIHAGQENSRSGETKKELYIRHLVKCCSSCCCSSTYCSYAPGCALMRSLWPDVACWRFGF